MRIAVIGAGAMGSVYGGLLSERNEVWLIDSRSELVDRIRAEGLPYRGRGKQQALPPEGVSECGGAPGDGPCDPLREGLFL
ncbi:hypothetical protein HMPREF1986_00545 [Oribacterium sp. oral taxon 078 str. F0263]|nr:2-dehydropantoate 2-reductase N-terminal domain-containing protein [Oribacterium sp. oral taxon 078]ERL22472.1 hypothetical protein HMPREF1986_00545 [Oribacterium sp. oral taxon 078 str. F0263]